MEMWNALLHIFVCTSVLALSNSEYSAVPSGRVIMDVRPVLLQGRQGDLQCTFSGRPIAVYWEKGDDYASAGNLITWYKERIHYHGHEGRFGINEDYSLILYNVTAEEEGKYFCRISNSEGVIIRNETDVTIKIPPSGGYPTIEECRNVSSRRCSLELEHENRIVNLTCRTDDASIGLVSLNWTLGCDHDLHQETEITSNPGGLTENIASTITAQPCDEAYVCLATLNATRVEPQNASVFVYFAIEETSTSKDATQNLGNKEKRTQIIIVISVVIPLMIILLMVFGVILLRYYRRKDRCKTGGESDMELVVKDCNQHHLRQGRILYLDLWVLVNLRKKEGEESKNYFLKLNKVASKLNKVDTMEEEPTRQSLYQRLCEWKEKCTDNIQKAKLKKAMKKGSLKREYQQMKETRKDATGELSDDDLGHVCWCLRDFGKTVDVKGDVLTFPDTTSENQETELNNIETLVSKEIALLKKWKEEFQRRHCDHLERGPNGENEPFLVTKSKNPLNPASELCRALEDGGLDKIAKTLFVIPPRYKRLSEDDMKSLAMGITQRHCLTLGKHFGLPENETRQKNSENSTALFDTVAMLKACRWNTGNYALRCKLRWIASEVSHPSEETKEAFIDQESSVIYQPQEQTQVTIEEECREEAVADSAPAKLSNQHVYHAEVVRVAYCILMEDILPFAKALGIDQHQLDRFRPPRNCLHQGTSSILLSGLRKCEKENPRKTRSQFVKVLRNAGFDNAAKLIELDYDISHTELSLTIHAIRKRKVPFPWKELNVSSEAIERYEKDEAWPAMKEWKTRTRREPYHYRSELALALKTAGLKDIASNVLSGKHKTPNIFPLEKIINDASDFNQLWDLIKGEIISDNTASKPSTGNELANKINQCMTFENFNKGLDRTPLLKGRLKWVNMLFTKGFYDLSNEYVVLYKRD